ncbi:MAG: YlmC/YmxH family sporulation protein [Clostridiales bacterium]|nr:YlmC/YmxH family sporulation protein [Clostridiales bacterium]
MSYCELKRREVINGSDGRRMGHIIDLIFTVDSGKIKGIILPYGKRGVFSKSQDLFVPWQCVQKIGEDVILVEIHDLPSGMPTCVSSDKRERLPEPPPPPPPSKKNGGRNCDGKCEKCMLFDCASRWAIAE